MANCVIALCAILLASGASSTSSEISSLRSFFANFMTTMSKSREEAFDTVEKLRDEASSEILKGIEEMKTLYEAVKEALDNIHTAAVCVVKLRDLASTIKESLDNAIEQYNYLNTAIKDSFEEFDELAKSTKVNIEELISQVTSCSDDDAELVDFLECLSKSEDMQAIIETAPANMKHLLSLTSTAVDKSKSIIETVLATITKNHEDIGTKYVDIITTCNIIPNEDF